MALRFNMLLRDEGIDPADVRLLRHQTHKVARRTPYTLWSENVAAFEAYQSTQNSKHRKKFSSPYWASFVAGSNGETLFVGLYKSKFIGPAAPDAIDPLSGLAVGAGRQESYDQYECILDKTLADYIGKLVINWGDSPSSTRAWVQYADKQDKEIVEIRKRVHEPAFPGFTKFVAELSTIEIMPTSWKEVLRVTKGVYLLACPRTREHYVGSASGDGGFLGRWMAYVADGHGGNIGLRERRPSDYRVSILEAAGSLASQDDIVRLEHEWMRRLHSREIGLNRNV